MAKKVIGQVTKSEKTNSFYIKLNSDLNLKAGTYLNLENEASQLQQVKYALEQGWIKEEEAEKRLAQVTSYWNDPVPTKKGDTFVRKDSVKYQVVVDIK